MNLNVNVNLELHQSHAQLHITDWHDILLLPQYISPAIEFKNWWVMGQHLVTHDPYDPSDFRDPFDPWPIPCSAARLRAIGNRLGVWDVCGTVGDVLNPSDVRRLHSSVLEKRPMLEIEEFTISTSYVTSECWTSENFRFLEQ